MPSDEETTKVWHILIQDEDSHWYVIPADERAQFYQWVKSTRDDYQYEYHGKTYEDAAIGGSPSGVTFSDYRIV
jgi:hypothetical protein